MIVHADQAEQPSPTMSAERLHVVSSAEALALVDHLFGEAKDWPSPLIEYRLSSDWQSDWKEEVGHWLETARATSLLRTLADLYIDLLYILTDKPNLLPRFYEYSTVAALRKKTRVALICNTSVEAILEQEYEEVRQSIDPSITSGTEYTSACTAAEVEARAKWKYRYEWAAISAFKKAVTIDKHRGGPLGKNEIVLVYELAYRMGSDALHSGMPGATSGVVVDGTTAVLHHDARLPRASQGFLVLLFATHLYLKVLDNVNSELGLGLESSLKRLDVAYTRIYKKPGTTPSSSQASEQVA